MAEDRHLAADGPQLQWAAAVTDKESLPVGAGNIEAELCETLEEKQW